MRLGRRSYRALNGIAPLRCFLLAVFFVLGVRHAVNARVLEEEKAAAIVARLFAGDTDQENTLRFKGFNSQ
jgi:hypothetical protein